MEISNFTYENNSSLKRFFLLLSTYLGIVWLVEKKDFFMKIVETYLSCSLVVDL